MIDFKTDKNSEEIVDKLVQLLNNKNYQIKLGKQARDWIMKYHDYKAVASKLRDIYLKCLVN